MSWLSHARAYTSKFKISISIVSTQQLLRFHCRTGNLLWNYLYAFASGPKWLPIVGNTSQLRREAGKFGGKQYGVFENWMDKYNSPVIGLKLGRELVVVAMTYPIVHEVHTSDAFDGRPDNFFLRLRTMGSRYPSVISIFAQRTISKQFELFSDWE